MVSAISNVSFRADAVNKDLNSLINDPGKYSSAQQQAPAKDLGADKVDLSTNAAKKEKSNTGAIIGGILGVLALTWIGLGVAVSKGKLNEIPEAAGWGEKLKNIAFKIGKSADDAYKSTFGKWFGKAEKTTAEATEETVTK